MEVDQSCIFGSFSRRPGGGAGGSRRAGAAAQCGLCRRPHAEPRVLPCLHSFCTRCLLRLGPWASADCDVSGKTDVSGSGGSAGSGYESEPRDSPDGSWAPTEPRSPRRRRHGSSLAKEQYIEREHHKETGAPQDCGPGACVLTCPTCGAASRLPAAGVRALPPNFVLQHRLLVAALHDDPSRLLCDLCDEEVPASARCTTCLVSLCGGCGAAHLRQRGAARHAVLPLADAARRGALTLRRQPLCPRHPDNELKLFCTTCCQVICRDCCLMSHSGHSFDPVSRAAEAYVRSIREAVDRVKPVVKQTSTAIEKLQTTGKRIQIRSGAVQDEVDQFIDSYVRAVQEHRQTLQLQVMKSRDVKVQAIANQRLELEKRVENVNDAVQFAEDILAEGTDIEVLSFVGPLLRRLEWCSNTEGLFEPRVSETVQLLKEEKACIYDGNHQLFGIISTQNVEPRLCIVQAEGLRSVRVHRPHEVIVETRDVSDQPLCRGGETVAAVIRRAGARPRTTAVQDRQDGTYLITFVPDASGNLQLAVLVNGKPIKDSPFNLTARCLRPHHGKFHCCTFCSSSGSKDATCACGGRMAGGYRGCGHGHSGHPGARHWSCCASTIQNSECGRSNSAIYQFSL